MAAAVTFLETRPDAAKASVLLAHGAGAPMTSAFMEAVTALLAERQLAVYRFEFSYMAERRDGGKRRPPPKAEVLIGEYRSALGQLTQHGRDDLPLYIGGKSLGGRIASMIANEVHEAGTIKGLVCLGYPFHPPGKPEQLRTPHLEALTCPALIVQGDRDPFGNRTEVAALNLSNSISFCWLGDGDHDFGSRGGSGFTKNGNLAAACDAVAAFMGRVTPRSR